MSEVAEGIVNTEGNEPLRCRSCDALVAQLSEVIDRSQNQSNITPELSYVLKVMPELRRKGDEVALDLAKLALISLSSNPPNIEVARILNKEIRRKLSLFSTITEMLKSSRASSNYVLLGLGMFLYVGIPVTSSIFQYVTAHEYQEVLGIDLYTFFIVFIFGAVGSIVSILSRIKDYEITTENEISTLFYTGLFKPVIGSAFALFVYAMIKAQLLPVAITPGNEIFIFISLSFLSGFSERFTNDVIGKAESIGVKPG